MAFIQLNRCFKEPNQFLRLIVLVICGCITIQQLSECVKKLLHPPVSTYSKFHLNETMSYPSLTFCRSPSYKNDLFPEYGMKKATSVYAFKAFSSFKFDEYNVDDFIEATTYPEKEMYLVVGFMGSAENLRIKSIYHLQYGRCYTLTALQTSNIYNDISGGYYIYFLHDEVGKTTDSSGESNTGFHIFLHDDNEVLTTDTQQEKNFLHYLYLETRRIMKVKLKVQKHNTVSTADEPCVGDPDYSQSKCEENCQHSQIAKRVGCATKWMRLPDNHSYPTCNDNITMYNMMSYLSPTTVNPEPLESCVCPRSCNVSIYTTYIIKTADVGPYHGKNSMLILYYESNIVEVLTKVIAYDWSCFLSDIGGSLGFLLGLSVIGLISVTEQAIQIVLKLICRKKREKLEEQAQEYEQKTSNKDVVPPEEETEDDFKNIKQYLTECDYFEKHSINKEREINKY